MKVIPQSVATVALLLTPKSLGGGAPYANDDPGDPNVQIAGKMAASTHVIVTARLIPAGALCTLRLIRFFGGVGACFAVPVGAAFNVDPAVDSGRAQRIFQQSDTPGLYGLWLVAGLLTDLAESHIEFGRSSS